MDATLSLMELPSHYPAFFERATGHAPYEYQRQLGQTEEVPSVLEIPTGAGKTQALLTAWLYQRLVRGAGPRRLVYALPMRTLVEQTQDVAVEIRGRLGVDPERLAIHTLMGGAALTDWRDHPERDQIIVGTIDMLLSRALGRGYGESRYEWPVSFGLLNADCRWIFDEVQLMGPARGTSAQLDGLRASFGTALACETIWASATIDRDTLETVDRPELGPVLGLAEQDRSGPLAARLTARKTLERLDLAEQRSTELPRRISAAVLDRHAPGSRSLIVLNTVGFAQATADALRRHLRGTPDPPEVVLLHSRFRPPDRAERMQEALASPEGGPGRIVVATQVIEAGVDTSARLLATETAPFSSIVQRLGRCNRAGECDDAHVLWLDRGEPTDRTAPPYHAADLAATRVALTERIGSSLDPEALTNVSVPERRVETAIPRRRDLLDLFDTTPDVSGMDVDVSRFIRDDDDRTVSVFFRPLKADAARGVAPEDQPAAGRDELVTVPIGELKGRRARRLDHVEGVWYVGSPVPGETVMLDAAGGGYSPLAGWDPGLGEPVDPVDAPGRPTEALDDDVDSVNQRSWMTLSDHLTRAHAAAQGLLEALQPIDAPTEVVVTAAGLHDLGKAHPAFQQMLLSGIEDEGERGRRRGTLWAKSDHRRGQHARRHFRHELASALALHARNGDGAVPSLAAYLVACHHGRVRLSIRPAPEERAPADRPDAERYALGVAEGDELPSVTTPVGEWPATRLSLGCMELGAPNAWARMACTLRDDRTLGPVRLAYLEALVRISDWRASA